MNISSTLDLFQRFKAEVGGDASIAGMLTLAHTMLQTRNEPENLSVKQAAKELGISSAKVYQLCESGQLRHRKIGRAIRIQQGDLQAFMDSGNSEGGQRFPRLGI